VLQYTAFNHSFLASGQSAEVIVADRIPVAPFARIGLSARIHSRNIGSGAQYQFIVRGINPSDADGADFVDGTDLGSTPATTGSTNPTTVPGVIKLSTIISDTQHPMVRVVLKATGPAGAAVNLYIVASADLVMRMGA
jgi:hypothetical protein